MRLSTLPAINIPSQEFLSNGLYLLYLIFLIHCRMIDLISRLHFSSADGTRNSFHHSYGMYWFSYISIVLQFIFANQPIFVDDPVSS